MAYYTLTNNFHESSARVVPATDTEGRLWIGAEAWKRAMRKLCGHHDCTCGGVRGPQFAPDGRRVTWEPVWSRGANAPAYVMHDITE